MMKIDTNIKAGPDDLACSGCTLKTPPPGG